MNIIITILLALVAVIVVFLIAALFVKKEYIIEGKIVVNTPKQAVFEYVKQFKNQKYYNKWTMTDPDVRLNYTGVDGEIGFISAWESDNKNVGKGEQEITKIVEGEKIETELRFIKPFTDTASAHFVFEEAANGNTAITWSLYGVRKYPLNLMLKGLDKMLLKDMQISLNNIKNILEK